MSKELLDYQILKLQNGSKLYGTDTPQSDDDYIGIFVEPPEYLFSLRKAETVPLHDRGPEERNFNADVDGIAYSLRHFIKLASDGNPSILCLLYAKPEHVIANSEEGQMLLDSRDLFLSRNAGPKFLGYMQSQLLRLKGLKKGHVPARPELIEKYGYDVKYAMQVARLAMQGVEYLRDGVITLPMDDSQRQTLASIRNGEFTYDNILLYLDSLDSQLKRVIDSGESPLPEEPDYTGIRKLSRKIHQSYWDRRNL